MWVWNSLSNLVLESAPITNNCCAGSDQYVSSGRELRQTKAFGWFRKHQNVSPGSAVEQSTEGPRKTQFLLLPVCLNTVTGSIHLKCIVLVVGWGWTKEVLTSSGAFGSFTQLRKNATFHCWAKELHFNFSVTHTPFLQPVLNIPISDGNHIFKN